MQKKLNFMKKSNIKDKQLNIKLSVEDLKSIKNNIEFYKNQGIKLNISKIVRDVLVNFPKANDYGHEAEITFIKDKPKIINKNKEVSLFWGLIKIKR